MRYKKLLKKADAIAGRLRGKQNSSKFCSDAAAAFFRVRDYARGQKWLKAVYTSRDKDVRAIERFFSSGDPRIDAIAVFVAGIGGKTGTAKKIVSLFLKTKNRAVRLAAYGAIGRIGSVQAASRLYEGSGLDKSISLAEEAALYKMLGLFKTERFRTVLKQRYAAVARIRRGAALRRLRTVIAGSLIASGGPGLTAFLRRIWRAEPSFRVVLARKLGSSRSDLRPFIRSVLPGTGQDLFVALMRSWASKGAEAAYIHVYLQALGRFEKAGISVAPLIRGLTGLPAATIRPVLHRYLKRIKLDFNTGAAMQQLITAGRDPLLVDAVLDSVKRRSGDIQFVSLMVDALGSLGSTKAVPYLEKALKHKAPGVRLLASQSLKKITGKTYQFKGFGE